jgi:hypothetical protein
MKNKLILVITICMFSNFSSQAAVGELENLEVKRTQVEFTDSLEFERLTRDSAKLLPETLGANIDLTLFSLIRTRKYFFGMPGMVPKLCGPGNKTLGLVDAVVTSAFLDPEFEEYWRLGAEKCAKEECAKEECAEKKYYDSKVLERTKESFEDEFGELTREKLEENKPLLDRAFQVYSIFAPRLTLGTIWGDLCVDGSEIFRGWKVKGLGAISVWIKDKEGGQETFLRIREDSYLPFKSATSFGIVRESSVEVTYSFDPWVLGEPAPLQLTFRKKEEPILGFLNKFLYSPKDNEKALEKAHSEVDVLRRAYRERSLSKKQRIYEDAIEAGLQEPSLFYELALLLQTRDKGRAESFFKSAADRGHPFAFTHYGLSLKEEGRLEEARDYLAKGSSLGSPHAKFHLAFMLEGGEGGERNSEKALRYFKESAALGNGPAAYEYALRLYRAAYKVFKESHHIPPEAAAFTSGLPKPL